MNEKEKKRNPNRQRKRQRNIFHDGIQLRLLVFLAFLVNIPYKKKLKAKFRREVLNFVIKNSKRFFVSKYLSSNPSPRLKKVSLASNGC